MTPSPPRPTLDALLANARFLRGLARSLVADPHLAEDLEQEAWVAAIRRPPREGTRAWFRAVLRNLLAKSLRGESRRARRESDREPPPPPAGPPEEAARRESLRAVLEAVLALEEPYRATVLARYYEDLSPAAIAAREGVPAGTVRSRLHRAHALLRERLDGRSKGDRRAWVLPLLPFAGTEEVAGAGAGTTVAAATGGILMATKGQAMAAGAAVALVLGTLLMITLHDGEGGASRRGSGEAASETGPVGIDPTLPSVRAPREEPGPGGTADSLPVRLRPVPVVGRVLDDETGAPVAGARFHLGWWGFEPDQWLTVTSGDDGRFHLDTPVGAWFGQWAIEADGYPRAEGFLPRLNPRSRSGETCDAGDLRLSRGARAAGRILGTPGGPGVAGARLLCGFLNPVHGEGGSFLPRGAWEAGRSGEDGSFDIERLAPPPHAGLRRTLFALTDEGIGWTLLPNESGTTPLTEIEVILRPTVPLVVTVTDDAGHVVPDAEVWIQPRFPPLGPWPDEPVLSIPPWTRPPEAVALFLRRTDGEGRARFDRVPRGGSPDAFVENTPAGTGWPVRLWKRDTYIVYARAPGFAPGRKDPVVLQVNRINEATLVLHPPRPCVVSGTVVTRDRRAVEGARVVVEFPSEAEATTDPGGAFVLPGLDPENGQVRLVVDVKGYGRVRRERALLPDGDVKGLEIVLDPVAPIGGVVVDEDGRPVAGAWVGATSKNRDPEGATTDAEGRFLIAGTPAGSWNLVVHVPDSRRFLVQKCSMEVEAGSTDLRIVIER